MSENDTYCRMSQHDTYCALWQSLNKMKKYKLIQDFKIETTDSNFNICVVPMVTVEFINIDIPLL